MRKDQNYEMKKKQGVSMRDLLGLKHDLSENSDEKLPEYKPTGDDYPEGDPQGRCLKAFTSQFA
jgi:hypothetical protein